MTAGGREDGGRENVQEKQQGAQEEDEGQTPVDGELQRRHVAPPSRLRYGPKVSVSSRPVEKYERPPSHLKQERSLCMRSLPLLAAEVSVAAYTAAVVTARTRNHEF